jgi:glycolate oxidase
MPLALPEPDYLVMRQRDAIVKDLRRLVPPDAIIADEEGRRAYETDALTAYRRVPLAVALPTSTEEVSRLLRYCHANDIKVVARGAGTSLSGGALPAEDALVITVSRMNRVLGIDPMNRTATVEVGITNLGISETVKAQGFFYAPDPSSQLACTLAGNIGMNSGGAHCLKYGVTTNNILGLKMVLMDGEIVDIGGAHLDAAGYDLMGLMVGSEGQFGIVTESTRAKPPASACRPSSLPASFPWRSSSWTSPPSRCARRSPRPVIPPTPRPC